VNDTNQEQRDQAGNPVKPVWHGLPARVLIGETPVLPAETLDLLYLGVTHRAAPLSVREALHATPEKQRTMLARLADLAPGRMILATCERFELYASTAHPEASLWSAALADWFHLRPEAISRYAVVLRGYDAAEHLLRVAAGLDSRVLGEPHVLGQVRKAYLQAVEARSLDPTLFALGRAAIHAGKRVRSETPINDARRSIATLAVEKVARRLERLRDATVLVTGTGRLAADVAAEFQRRGAGRIIIAGRNFDRTEALAKKCHGMALVLLDLPGAIAEVNAVVSCTAAASYVIEPSSIGARRSRDLHIVDLSMPRNVDPDVARLPRLELTPLETLLAEQPTGAGGLAAAERVVREESARFAEWHRERCIAEDLETLTERSNTRGRAAAPTGRQVMHDRIVRLNREAAA